MAPAFCLILLLNIFTCCVRAQGDDISNTCPSGFPVATSEVYTSQNVTCTVEKVVYTTAGVCNLGDPTAIRFDLKDAYGVTTTLCTADYNCPSSDTNTVGGLEYTCGCTSADDNGTHLSHTLTLFPGIHLHGGTISCKVKCLSDKTEPSLVSYGCDNITIENPCGGCDSGKLCNETTSQCVAVNPCGECDSGKLCNETTSQCVAGNPCGECDSGKLCNETTSQCVAVNPCGECGSGKLCNETTSQCVVADPCNGNCKDDQFCDKQTATCKEPDNTKYVVVIIVLSGLLGVCILILVILCVVFYKLRKSKPGTGNDIRPKAGYDDHQQELTN